MLGARKIPSTPASYVAQVISARGYTIARLTNGRRLLRFTSALPGGMPHTGKTYTHTLTHSPAYKAHTESAHKAHTGTPPAYTRFTHPHTNIQEIVPYPIAYPKRTRTHTHIAESGGQGAARRARSAPRTRTAYWSACMWKRRRHSTSWTCWRGQAYTTGRLRRSSASSVRRSAGAEVGVFVCACFGCVYVRVMLTHTQGSSRNLRKPQRRNAPP